MELNTFQIISITIQMIININMLRSSVIFAIYICLISPIVCNRINSKLYNQLNQNQNHVVDTGATMAIENDHLTLAKQRNDNTIAYVKASIPIRIFQCMQSLSILKCMKIFILQRMERTPIYVNSGNLTADFLDQILATDNDNKGNEDLFDRYYVEMDEGEINERLLKSFQRFFKNREIKLHFIPGMVVRVVPSDENAINLSLKRG